MWNGTIKPYLRTRRLRWLGRYGRRLAAEADRLEPVDQPGPIAFFVGAGRSGTTILGQTFFWHPQVRYLFEPYHLWAAIDPRTDVTNLHTSVAGLLFMDGACWTETAQRRFDRLMATPRMGLVAVWSETAASPRAMARALWEYGRGRRGRPGDGRRLVIEKTPHNVLRIGYLERLAPTARYVHIVRSGVDAARSIGRLAGVGEYRIVDAPRYDRWWGQDGAKWTALRAGGIDRGYVPDEVDRLDTNERRGAYEWLVSVMEATRWQATHLGARMLEVRYPDLTGDARGTLSRICAHLGLDAPEAWLAEASAMIGPERKNRGEPLRLPPAMARLFNEYQERFGFAERAEVM